MQGLERLAPGTSSSCRLCSRKIQSCLLSAVSLPDTSGLTESKDSSPGKPLRARGPYDCEGFAFANSSAQDDTGYEELCVPAGVVSLIYQRLSRFLRFIFNLLYFLARYSPFSH